MSDATQVTLPAKAAQMLAVEILLADLESLGDDVLESCLYVLREKLRADTRYSPTTWQRSVLRPCDLSTARAGHVQVVAGDRAGQRDDVGERGAAVQQRPDTAFPARGGRADTTVGADGQDALDHSVGRIGNGDRLRAGRLKPGRVMPVGQPDQALGGPQPAERVVRQLTDDLLARRAGARGVAAPGGCPHVERDACPASCAGGSWPASDEEHHHRGGEAHVSGLADVLPRHRVRHTVDLGADVRADLRLRSYGQHERLTGQQTVRLPLDRSEHRDRCDTVQRPTWPPARDFQATADRLGLHRRQGRELRVP